MHRVPISMFNTKGGEASNYKDENGGRFDPPGQSWTFCSPSCSAGPQISDLTSQTVTWYHIVRLLTGPAGVGGHLCVLGGVADVSVVLLPVLQEGEDGVDEEEEDHAEDDDLLDTDAQLCG